MAEQWLVLSDIHDDIPALRTAVDFGMAQHVSRIMCLGDLALRPFPQGSLERFLQDHDAQRFVAEKRRHSGQVLAEMTGILNASGIPHLVIPGNYDGCLTEHFGDHDLHGKSTHIGEAKVVGYGGGNANPPHIELLRQIKETMDFDDMALYQFLHEQQPNVALVHNPPLAFCDDLHNGKHAGTAGSALYMREYRSRRSPLRLMLSGHIHEAGPNQNNPNGVAGVALDQASGTVVLNPGNLGRFELLEFPSLRTARQFDYGTFITVDVEANGQPTRVVQYTVQPQDRGDRDIGQVRGLRDIRFERRT